MSDYKSLILDHSGPITTVTLNRPEVHNALDRALSDELNRAVRAANADRECRIMILRGAGDTFCAGDDIKDFLSWTPEDPYWQVRLYRETVKIIEDLEPVTIAAVDGVCTGGGLEPQRVAVEPQQDRAFFATVVACSRRVAQLSGRGQSDEQRAAEARQLESALPLQFGDAAGPFADQLRLVGHGDGRDRPHDDQR